MFDNTYLGMKSSDHHRSEKEAEATTWELTHPAGSGKKNRRASIARIYMSFIALLISGGIGLTVLTSGISNESSNQEATSSVEVETAQQSRGGYGSSDAFPWLDMIE